MGCLPAALGLGGGFAAGGGRGAGIRLWGTEARFVAGTDDAGAPNAVTGAGASSSAFFLLLFLFFFFLLDVPSCQWWIMIIWISSNDCRHTFIYWRISIFESSIHIWILSIRRCRNS